MRSFEGPRLERRQSRVVGDRTVTILPRPVLGLAGETKGKEIAEKLGAHAADALTGKRC
jgi:hypothetical protein